MRLADADTTGRCAFEGWSGLSAAYVDDLVKMTDKMRTDTEDRNKMPGRAHAGAGGRSANRFRGAGTEIRVPYLNFAALQNSVAAPEEECHSFLRRRSSERRQCWPLETRKKLDEVLIQSDRALIREEGLPAPAIGTSTRSTRQVITAGYG